MSRCITKHKHILSSMSNSRKSVIITEQISKQIAEASNTLAEGPCQQAESVVEKVRA